MPKTGGYGRLMKVLELVGEEPGGVSVTTVAHHLGMSKGSASRLLASLVEAGFLERDTARRHFLSIRIWSLGTRALGHLRIADMARPLIYEAARSSGLSIYLAVIRDDCAYMLEQVTAPHGVAMSAPLSNVLPHYASAPGKAILAFCDEETLEAMFARPLISYTKYTITSREAWEKEFAEIREQGFAVNRGEFIEDTLGVAVPIFDQSGIVVASIGNSVSRAEFNERYIDRTSSVLQAVASTLSSALGFKPRAF
jgi:DNA-binding IclR family transcriptional regulator